MTKVAVLGATGFVGSAVVDALTRRGATVLRVSTPRLQPMTGAALDTSEPWNADPDMIDRLADAVRGCAAVVCASGDPDASNTDETALNAANAGVPALVGRACLHAGVPRFVHVSSAVVQGRLPLLDDSDDFDSFSAYARSKERGEVLAHRYGPLQTVCYRPPSVHAPSRRVTRSISRLAASPLAAVAAPGDAPSPQALIGNVADAIAFLALTDLEPLRTVHHPSEGLTTASLMKALGGRDPRRVPQPIARAVVGALRQVGNRVPAVAANARRVEMMWFGQEQAESWLTRNGWVPPHGLEDWQALGRTVRSVRGGENT